MIAADLLRLVAVPAFAWAAWHDYHTRRVPADRRLWYPLAAVGLVALALDAVAAAGDPFAARLLLLQVAVSVGFLTALGYGFWWFGLFGGADRKAFVVLGLLFPTAPFFELGGVTLPVVRTALGVLSLSVVTNAALLGLAYPLVLAARNALAREFGPAMFLGRSIPWTAVPRAHGKLMESTDGVDLDGLDLDALRMYLRWRGLALAEVRARADELRDPATLPDEPNPPTGGAVGEDDLVGDPRTAGEPSPDGGDAVNLEDSVDDPWGAEAFLASIDGTAYGTTPRKLREGLDVLAARDAVWVMPGIPFIVPLFLGLVVALTVGDVLFGVLGLLGLV